MTLPQNVGEWIKQADPVIYDRETIFDYINGAGEVYRSYDFSQVTVERYERPEAEGLTVEVFDMGNSHDAFGVFSYAREREAEGIGAGFESRGSILCFWQDRFYICLAAEQRYDDPGPILELVAQAISAHFPDGGERPDLVAALPAEGLIPFSDRFFHVHQTLNYNRYLVRENILNLSPETDAVLARYGTGSTYLVMIEYDGDNEASQALSSFLETLMPGSQDGGATEDEDGRFLTAAQEGPFLAVVLDAPSESEADDLRSAALQGLSLLSR